jgi:integrase/recombinase XerD
MNSSTAVVPGPDFGGLCDLVLNAVSSPITRQMYARALHDFFAWWEGQGRPAFQRSVVQAHRTWLEERGYTPSTVNQRLAAIRKLAREAAANGWLAQEIAGGILAVPGVKQQGHRAGNWLTKAQTEALLHAPDPATRRGQRDRLILALLTGCGLRRGEATRLTVGDVQQRDGRWVLVDLRGKHGRIRTVPVPNWVKQTLDAWLKAASITDGRLLRPVTQTDAVSGSSLSDQAVFDIVREYGRQAGLQIRPHDLRRTCARLCRNGGGELEQIQLLLGHASIQTTERYLGTRQNLADAPNDRLGLGWQDARS